MCNKHGYFITLFFCIFLLASYPVVTESFPEVTVASCDSPANPIQAENCLPGNPAAEWDISGAGDPSIQGFATDISVNRGETVAFKIKTDAVSYQLDIYRMGYYGGMGARKVATVTPSAALPQFQPACLIDATTGLIDCGNWAMSASWAVPADATSGIYFAKVVRTDTGGASHIVFVVRDDAGTSDLLFQTSDTTWQAYNYYGGNSLYWGSVGRAYKVSYNRPFYTRIIYPHNWLFNAEYPMVRWLEANGYHVSYFSGVDSDRRGSLLLNHKAFLSVGHDEYWSGEQRANVEAARDAGVHLAFFSGNEIFLKTRWENSIDGSATPYRTLVCYKETLGDAIDPHDPPTWTGTWRDPRFSPPADGGRPENALSGTIFMMNWWINAGIEVPDGDGQMRFWRNTSIATLAPGAVEILPNGTLGHEADVDLDNGFRPAGLIRLSTTTINVSRLLQDYGAIYAPGTATHHLTLYRHSSGALVFGAGTVQWSWGLDVNHDLVSTGSTVPDESMQQATVNLFADMGVQPVTLQSGLIPATASTDTIAPISTIISPVSDSSVPIGSSVTIGGTATDTGGGVVGGVEVSVDGGTTWHPANGRATWNFTGAVSSVPGPVTILSRAVDDSGNIEVPGAGVDITVPPDATPPTVTATFPAADVTDVEPGTTVTATFSEAIDPATLTSSTFGLQGVSDSTVTYDPATRIATLRPSSPLAVATTYTATVKGGVAGVRDLAGNALNTDITWSFTTSVLTYSAWNSSNAPPGSFTTSESLSVELGIKFKTDVDGFIRGIRFYKGIGNTGTHQGTLWSSSGQQLATATFTNETATGWQQVDFATPVAITANTVYVASYYAPNGHVTVTRNYFTTAGVDNPPVHLLRNGESGNNGLYIYSSSPPTFPNLGVLSSNFWVDVVFTLTAPPAIALSANTLAFTFENGQNPAAQTLALSNTGGGTMNWSVAADPAAPAWLSVSPGTGVGNAATLTVAVDGLSLAPGVYQKNITVTAVGANTSRIVPVSLTVVAPPVIAVSPSSLSFTVQDGKNPAAQTLALSNAGGGEMNWSATADPAATWLSVSPGTGVGNAATLTVAVDGLSLAPGVYQKDITVTAVGANTTRIVPVSLTVVAPPVIAVSPSSLSFTMQQNSQNPAAQTLALSNAGGGTMNWSVAADPAAPAWLSVSPGTGVGNAATLTVAVDGLSLAPGVYQKNITVTAVGANTPQIVPVSLTVVAPPVIAVSPSSLSFTVQDGKNPAAQTLALSNAGGGEMNWSATADPAATWLSVSPANGVGNAATLTVAVDGLSLAPGVYQKDITVTAVGANTSRIVPVSLTVVAPPVIAVSPSSLSFTVQDGKNPAAQTLALSNAGGGEMNWSATADPAATWLSVSPGTGVGNAATLTVAVDGLNLASGVYQKNITVSAAGANTSKTVPVSLMVCSYSLDKTSKSFSKSAGNDSIKVTSSTSTCGWTAVGNVAWITITSGSSGIGNATVTYTVSKNNTGQSRTGTITVAGKTFTVTQSK